MANLKLSNDNKRLQSRYYTVKSNYWRTQSIARPICNSRSSYLYRSDPNNSVVTPKDDG